MVFHRRHFGHFLVNFLLHSRCILCEKPLQDTAPLCGPCFEGLDFSPVCRCVKCGRELSGALAEAECLDCRKRRFHYGELRVLGTWDTKLRSLVHGLKFEQRHSVAAVLADSLAGFIDPAFFLVDCMVPVPLHGKRLKERGYNQSLLILERLGRRLGVPVLPDGLRRTRNTRPQSQLSREERLENVRDAFGPGRQAGLLAGKRVLLFDDVMTTGNTLNEASRILAKCGPASVRLLVVARAE